jgi:DNA-binding NarL/FixJ family response regulator
MFPKVTPRNQDVINCLIEGMKQKEIAAVLGISRSAVKRHLRDIYRRFGLEDSRFIPSIRLIYLITRGESIRPSTSSNMEKIQ